MSEINKQEVLAHIVKKEVLMHKPEGTIVQSLCLIQNYGTYPQKNGGNFLAGQLQLVGSLPFKVWSNSDAFARLSTTDMQNKIVLISGRVDRYGGVPSIIIEEVDVPTDDILSVVSELDFMEEKYDSDEIVSSIRSLIKSKCSEGALAVWDSIQEMLGERFKVEFAAVSHHDNVKSGLAAHTLKVLRISTVTKLYPELFKVISPDLLYLGCALHDIGKVLEYSNGVVSERGKRLSHHTFGVLILAEKSDFIIETMGQVFYDSLLSIVEQHHGEYEERPRTLAAYIVHKFDMLDSTLTSIETALQTGDGMIRYDNFQLTY